MFTRSFFLTFFALFFLSIIPTINAKATECGDIELCKKIPPGFTLQESRNHVGSFLRPDGWFLKEEISGETYALFITRENIDTDGRFLTGFSVNKVPGILTKTKTPASKYAREVADRLRVTGVILGAGIVSGNSIDMNIVRKKLDKDGATIIVHYITIGNDGTDTFYLISFEAPESLWEKEIQIGTPMLNFFAL